MIAIDRVRFIIMSCTRHTSHVMVCDAHGFAVLVSTESIHDAHGHRAHYYYYKSAVQDSQHSKVLTKV